MGIATTTWLPALVYSHYSPYLLRNSNKLLVSKREDLADFWRRRYSGNLSYKALDRAAVVAGTMLRGIRCSNRPVEEGEGNDAVRGVLRLGLLTLEAVYILWLFLLPYAPGDLVWAISSETINSLIGLSLNFFFILSFANVAGICLLDAPVQHPISKGLFNFVIAWTVMFAPLLYTDQKRDQYKGSLDVLWGLQMFLTNTFLIPYMAIRMNEMNPFNLQERLQTWAL